MFCFFPSQGKNYRRKRHYYDLLNHSHGFIILISDLNLNITIDSVHELFQNYTGKRKKINRKEDKLIREAEILKQIKEDLKLAHIDKNKLLLLDNDMITDNEINSTYDKSLDLNDISEKDDNNIILSKEFTNEEIFTKIIKNAIESEKTFIHKFETNLLSNNKYILFK